MNSYKVLHALLMSLGLFQAGVGCLTIILSEKVFGLMLVGFALICTGLMLTKTAAERLWPAEEHPNE